MEMHQIRYFLAVARTLNFTQAAEECNVAQPSLSRAIKKLEEELGGDLFRRERSLTHMTDLGRIMLPLLTQAFETASSAKMLATTYRKGAAFAPLRLALSSTIDLRLLIGPLSRLMEAMPGLELKFARGTSPDVAEQLKSGESEIAVAGPLVNSWDRFRSWSLYHARFNLFMHRTHRLAFSSAVSLPELAGERLLGRPYCEASQKMTQILAESGIHTTAGDQAASDQDVLTLLDANVGVSILPEMTPHSDTIRSVPIEGLDLECTIMLHTVVGRQHTPASAGLVQLLRAANWGESVATLRNQHS